MNTPKGGHHFSAERMLCPLFRGSMCCLSLAGSPSSASSSKLGLYIAVPVAAVVLLVIAILVVILLYNCIVTKKSDEPYSYRPLSDKAEEDDLERDDQEDVGRGEEGMGTLGDAERGGEYTEKGEDN